MTAYWYLTRGTGVVALILLTITVALGVANARRLRTRWLPRFVVDAVHRNVALLSVAFVFVHVATTLLDGYVPIRVIDAVVPFTSAYRPFWVGLGALSLDLLAAVVITSLLRRRLGYRAWRATHWAAYASWPVALLHSVGIGTDASTPWMIAIVVGCVAVVLVALAVRILTGRPAPASRTAPRTAPLRGSGWSDLRSPRSVPDRVRRSDPLPVRSRIDARRAA